MRVHGGPGVRFKRVWIVWVRKRGESFPGGIVLPGFVVLYLKDPMRTGRAGDWCMDKSNALWWGTKREAESAAILYATKHPDFLGGIGVTHRMKRFAL